MSCETNLREVFAAMEVDKEKEAEFRASGVKDKRRAKSIYAFIDLKKAYDRVKRDVLV